MKTIKIINIFKAKENIPFVTSLITNMEENEKGINLTLETGTPTTNGQNWKIKEFDTVQGAYKGKETSWVVTKESQDTIHSHPIDADVARKLLK